MRAGKRTVFGNADERRFRAAESEQERLTMLLHFKTTRKAYLADLRISKSQKTFKQYELVLRKFGEWLEQTAAEQPQEQITPTRSSNREFVFPNSAP